MKEPPPKEKKELTPAELDKVMTKVQAGKFSIYRSYPFLGHILQRLSVHVTYDIPTMAVDDHGNIYINPDFGMNKLNFEEFIGVLAHETMHIATMTFFRERGRDHHLWNVATDYVMNRDLLAAGFKLPKEGCNPTQDGDKKWHITFMGKKKKEVKLDITDVTAEYLYAQLVKHAEKIYQIPLDQVLKGQGGQNGDEKEGSGNSNGQKIKVLSGSDPANKGKEEIKNDVISAQEASKQEQADMEKNRGTCSAGVRSHIMTHHQPKVNWRQLLKSIVAKTITEYNWKRPHKRAMACGYYAPRSQTQDNLAPITVAIDTSGSISQKELTCFITEITNIFRIYRKAKINVILWESDAYFNVEVNDNTVGSLTTVLTKNLRWGGTTMSSVVPYIKKHDQKKYCAAVIYLTDGYVEETPQLMPYPTKNYALITDPNGFKGLSKCKDIQCHHIDID